MDVVSEIVEFGRLVAALVIGMYIMEKRGKRIVVNVISELKKSEEFKETFEKGKEVMNFVYLFVKKLKRKEALNSPK